MNRKSYILIVLVLLVVAVKCFAQSSMVVAPGAKVEKLADIFGFTEGPAADAKGNIYFTDQPNDKIYKWSVDGSPFREGLRNGSPGNLSVFLEATERANGLYFDKNGNLCACADLNGRLISFDLNGKMTILADNYKSKKFNGPNDMWIDSKGGIYFTDPLYHRKYWTSDRVIDQDGQHVYYLKPDGKEVIRVTDDLVQPNGIIGTPDGKKLYVADIKAGKTFVYDINEDGTLSNKKLFCSMGSDGMTIDNKGNIYLTGKGVTVFDSAGVKIDHIDVNEPWTANVCFGGKDNQTLFITASDSLYSIRMQTKGVSSFSAPTKSVVAPGAKVEKLAGGFSFTEGPTVDVHGNIYFTDIFNNRIHIWSPDGKLSTFRENSGGANGLFFDKNGNLFICEGGRRQVVSIDPQGKTTILADKYNGKRLNRPNDLWVDLKGGVYFSDPFYGKDYVMEQDGQHVYYITPDRDKIIRVIEDMVQPNGLIGTADGKTLYVADPGRRKTFVYSVNEDGTLADKKLFVARGSDGMTIDNQGNIYLTTRAVLVFNSAGERIDIIRLPEQPSNLCFGGSDKQTLYITARTSIYSLKMQVKGL